MMNPTDPATTQQPDPTKPKPAGALPLASSPTLSAPNNPMAAMPAGPTTPATPSGPTGPVPPTGPATTSDPMAFATGSTPAGGPVSTPGSAPGALPLAGMTEQQKNEYWGAQGVPVLTDALRANPAAGANGQPALSSTGANTYDPSSVASSQASLTAGAHADPAVEAALNGLAAGIAKGPDTYNTTPDVAEGERQAWEGVKGLSAASGWGKDGYAYGGSAGSYNNLPLATPPSPDTPNGGGTPFIGADPTVTPGATSGGIHSPGPANDVNGSIPANPPSATLNGLPASASQFATAAGPNAVSLKPTDPNNPLTAQTLSVGPTADRFKLAQDKFDQFTKATDPAYQAELRSQDAHDFGAGRGVSGMHRNSIGDIATQRANALDTQRNSFLDSALTGSIDDAYKNVGIAQQQQGFQAGEQQTGFNQATTLQGLADSEAAQSFAQAMAQAGLGFSGSPADFLKWIAGQYARSGAA